MRKGHRRTQSACISTSSQLQTQDPPPITSPNEILRLLQASESKVENKVITYDRLDVANQHENKFLSFGNFSLRKFNKEQQPPKLASRLLCIPETNKSSEISSQPLSQSHEDEASILEKDTEIPKRKKKPKRGSDFRRLENVKKQNSYSELPNSARARGNETEMCEVAGK